jgi:phosphate acyltransferase
MTAYALNPLTIALDAMGGDSGPDVVIAGAALAALRHPEIRFALYGDQSRITEELARHKGLSDQCSVHHCDVTIAMDEKPSQALRRGRGKSSMWNAIAAVKEGSASAAVSAGNTGALMAMSRFVLRTMPGIERPALAAVWPTMRSESVVLDMGASIGADAKALVAFALMGKAMARALFNIEAPSIGLLNIGVEEVKGNENVKEAQQMLRELTAPINYIGFVEGDDIAKGTADVVVTEGFTGNIALKTAEGTAKLLTTFLKSALNASLLTKAGAFLAKGAFDALKDRLDPRKHNGAVFLGLNGIVVKSHGSTDALGYATAIDVAIDMVRNGLVEKITEDVAKLQHVLEAERPKQMAEAAE